MIKAVIFDLCGVLTDDVWEHMFLDRPDGLAARFGLDPAQMLQVGRGLWHAFAYRPAASPQQCQKLEYEYWTSLIRTFGLPVSAEYLAELTDQFIFPVPGMPELVVELYRRGLELLICSDNTEFFYQRQMRKLDLVALFPDPAKIVLSCRVEAAKADGSHQMFSAVSAALNCRVEECLYVDDRAENIARALEVGISGILFPAAHSSGQTYLAQLLTRMQM